MFLEKFPYRVKFYTKGFGHTCGVRVHRVQRGRFLGLTGPMDRRVLKFDGPLARGLWYRPAGDEFVIPLRGLENHKTGLR